MIKYIYIFFTGLLISFLIGMGIEAFYPSPTSPEFPGAEVVTRGADSDSVVVQEDIQQYEEDYAKYEEEMAAYNRNVSMIAVGFSIALLVLALIVMGSMPVVSDGALLGGLFTLLYGIGRSFYTDDSRFRFIIVLAGLFVVLIMGYIYFVKPSQQLGKGKNR